MRDTISKIDPRPEALVSSPHVSFLNGTFLLRPLLLGLASR